MKNKHNSKEGSLVRYCTFLLCYRFGRDVLLNGGPIISVGFCLSVKKKRIQSYHYKRVIPVHVYNNKLKKKEQNTQKQYLVYFCALNYVLL